MIPTLLWRCPLCAQNDSLKQKSRLASPVQIQCLHCQTRWKVRRVIGDDYWLQVTQSTAFPEKVGIDHPLTHWYDRMKETISLVPVSDPIAPLETGEKLYLASRQVLFIVNPNDPLVHEDHAKDLKEIKWFSTGVKLGTGRVFLTDRRVIWLLDKGKYYAFPLTKINSVYAAANQALVLLFEIRLLELRFLEESLLKWLTYFAFVAKKVKETSNHLITTSHY